MILNDEPNTPSLEVAAVSALVDAGAAPALELTKPIDPSNHEAWHDVEDGRIDEGDLYPFFQSSKKVWLLRPHKTSLSPHHSSGSSQDLIK